MQPNPVASGAKPALPKNELRAKRFARAKNYRELYLLPRWVEDTDENGKKTRRKLEPGEVVDGSQLYSIFTPISEMSDFGIGIGMYFRTTLVFGFIMLVCGLFQLPTAVYFDTSAYDTQNWQDRTWKVGGTASCLTEQRVCLDEDCTLYAGEFHFPSKTVPRFDRDYYNKVFIMGGPPGAPRPGDDDTVPLKKGTPGSSLAARAPWRDKSLKLWDDDGNTHPNDYDQHVSANYHVSQIMQIGTTHIALSDKVVVQSRDKVTVGKRTCNLRAFFGYTDFVMMIFVSAALLIMGKIQNKEAEALDEAEQTAQDYSVVINDPNPEKVDPDYYKDWFEERFGKGSVFSVAVCLSNGQLLNLYKIKRNLEYQIVLEAIEEAKFAKVKRRASEVDEGFLSQLQMNQSAKSYFKQAMEFLGLDPTLEYFTMELLKVNLAISKVKHIEYKATKVFITFQTEKAQRECLEKMCVGSIPAALDWKDSIADQRMLMEGNLLNMKEAPEPSSILYENLQHGTFQHLKEQLISWFILGIGIIICYFSVDACFQQGEPVLGAILISVWNSILPMINRYLVTSFETHHTLDDLEDSFLSKTVAARGFCSSIILYLVGIDHSSQILSPYYIGAIQAVLLADALTSPVIRVADVGGNINRYILAPIAGTDDRAKALAIGTDYLLAERYTDLAKTMLMSLFFSAIFPLGYFYSTFACFLNFWVDKYCVLRLFRQKPPASDKLVRITRTFAACIVLIHSVITAHFYYGWPFDNLCVAKQLSLSVTGQQVAEQIGADTGTVYRQCDATSSHLIPPTKEEPWFQSDGVQYKLIVFYNAISVLTLCYICIAYFGLDATYGVYGLFYYRHEAIGEAQGDQPYDKVDTGEGYVPQFVVQGINHSILAVAAPVTNSFNGGLEFGPYLLNWTPAKELTGDPEADKHLLEISPQDKDEILRKANIYFDDQFEDIPADKKNTCLFSRYKQYIVNSATAEGKALHHALAGRLAASHGVVGADSKLAAGAQKAASAAMQSVQATVHRAGGDTQMAVFAKPADESALAAMASGYDDDDDRRPTTQYPTSMSGGGYN